MYVRCYLNIYLNLCKWLDSMETKTYRQFGTFSVIVFLPLTLLFAGFMIKSGFSRDPVTIIQIFLFITFLICLLLFYQLTISVDNNSISFSLGIGLAGKSYKLSEIKSCKAVKNPALYGVGIRMISNGWLYNVSGTGAIELQFKNRKSIVRIGTDKPEEIADIVNRLMTKDPVTGNVHSGSPRMSNPAWIIVVLLFILPAALLLSGKQESVIYTSQDGLEIEGFYGLSIPFTDLIEVDTVSTLPKIAIKTNGYSMGNTKIGNFKFKNGEQAKLFVENGFPPYIYIRSKNNKPVYINYEKREQTIDLYYDLIRAEENR